MKLLSKFGSHALIMASAIVSSVSFPMLYVTMNDLGLFASMAVITIAELLFVVPSQIWITKAITQQQPLLAGLWHHGSVQCCKVCGGPRNPWSIMSFLALVTFFGYLHHMLLLKQSGKVRN